MFNFSDSLVQLDQNLSNSPAEVLGITLIHTLRRSLMPAVVPS